MFKVMSVFGTRPEAIKMCPLVKTMEECTQIDSVVCLTGQHKEMLQQVIEIFNIEVRYNLDIMKQSQSLSTITSSILEKIEPVLIYEKPDLVLVHGDTTTSFAVALAAFYQKIPVGHIEAGLRTHDKCFPFPEEMNRTLTSKIADLHFAPTERNRKNLYKENIVDNVYVTGNTVIDAFSTTVKPDYNFKNSILQKIAQNGKRLILITAHRRENIGNGLREICLAVKELAKRYQDIEFIYPVHLNPLVQKTVRQCLGDIQNIYLLDPLDVEDMHNLLSRSYLVLTDSGGLQEEAPYFGVPVIVLRSETERPEAVEAGAVKIVGTDQKKIVSQVESLLLIPSEYNRMARVVSPYGDGHACERIIEHILEWKND